MWMSRSGLSASRNRSCAITTFATSSFIGVPRKIMRSMRRRDKTTEVRSPRLDRSITYGVYSVGMTDCSSAFGLNFVSFREPVEDLLLRQAARYLHDAADLFQLSVQLPRIYPALFPLYCPPVIELLHSCRQFLLLGHCPVDM